MVGGLLVPGRVRAHVGAVVTGRSETERRGVVEIRWSDGDPDDVAAPWPREHDGTPLVVHVERMDDGDVWMAITNLATDEDVHMWFRAVKKGVLEWTVRDA